MWRSAWRAFALAIVAAQVDARGSSALRGGVANAGRQSSAELSYRSLADSSAEDGVEASKETPIQRVIKLLQEMKLQLEDEMQKEQEMYDKMVCWCKTNNKEKTQAISDAEASISQLESEVAQRSGRNAELSTNIDALKAELAVQKESLETSTAIREKELAAFNAAENDMIEAVSMLRNAIVVLSCHHNSTGLLQVSPAVVSSLRSALHWAALRHEELLALRAEHGDVGAASSALRRGSGQVRSHVHTRQATLLSVAIASSTSAEERELWRSIIGDADAAASAGHLPVNFAARLLSEEAARSPPSLMQQQGAKQPANYQRYTPQSGQILGLLKQMQEDFEASLSEAQREELLKREQYAQLKTAMEAQIEASAAKLDELEADASSNAKALSDAKEDLGTTRDMRAADVKFLSDLRLECQDLDFEWKKRSAARSEEIKAVAEAMAILTEDDAREIFHKKMGTGGSAPTAFVQVGASAGAASFESSSAAAAMRKRAVSILSEVSNKLAGGRWQAAFRHGEYVPSDRLAAVALQVQLDSFARVKEAIDAMVADLKSQQESEIKENHRCRSDLDSNEKDTYATNRTLLELGDQIADLSDTIDKLTKGIEDARTTIGNTQVELKAASEARKEENKEYQAEVTDQRAIQELLQKAIARMRMVYKGSGLIQRVKSTGHQEPPVKFNPYKQSEAGTPVISLMEQIVGDAQAAEKEALDAEQAAQASYAGYVRDATASVKALRAAIETKEKARAAAATDKAEKEADEKNAQERLENLAEVVADLHVECDFALKNFDIRQKARLQEIEALVKAKAILSGMQGK